MRGWDRQGIYTLHDPGYGAITVFDSNARLAIYATADASGVPPYERAAPLRALLHWCLCEPGRHLVHAGAVGSSDGGVLVAGRSGSGKSTLALWCVAAGLGYLGDDYVLVDVNGAVPTAHSVHGTAKLDPDGSVCQRETMPHMPTRDISDGGKVVLDVFRHRPSALLRSTHVRAVLLPRVGGGSGTRVRETSAAEGVRAVGPSTVLQHFAHGPSGLATVAELMRRVPVYVIELGPDMASAVEAVRSLAQGSQ